ncbi:MAG: MIP/aquaporin family protein [Calditrichia bacterium]
MKNYLMEFVGTLFFVLVIALSGNPLAIGVMLMLMVYVGGHVSGGHFNPAVTLAVLMRGKMDSKDVPGYMISQVAGAFAAAVLAYWFQGKGFTVAAGAGVGVAKVLVAEILFTFVLASVVLNTATTKALEGNYIYGLAIGLTITASAYAIGNISGCAINPAVAFGPSLFDLTQGGSSISGVWVYIIGPLLGGALAAILFKVFNPDEV